MTPRVVLWQLPWSPPSVRVRWALHERGVPYTARLYLPATHHTVRLRWATGQQSVPVAWVDGEAVAGSTAIARAIDPLGTRGDPLFFGDPALDAEIDAWDALSHALFDAARRELGPALARDREALTAVITPGPAWAHALVPLIWRVGGWDWARRYGVLATDREAARAEIGARAGELEARRAGRRYLVGDRFSYADLAVATYLGIARATPWLPTPPELARHYATLAGPGPWDPLYAWRDALLEERRPELVSA